MELEYSGIWSMRYLASRQLSLQKVTNSKGAFFLFSIMLHSAINNAEIYSCVSSGKRFGIPQYSIWVNAVSYSHALLTRVWALAPASARWWSRPDVLQPTRPVCPTRPCSVRKWTTWAPRSGTCSPPGLPSPPEKQWHNQAVGGGSVSCTATRGNGSS